MAGDDSSSSPPLAAGPGLCAAPNTGATAGTRKRKGPAATAAPKKARKPPKDYGTNQAYVYYGLRRQGSIMYMEARDLQHCSHVIGELPQPRSMSFVDLQHWIIKLFQLHPETQDLEIRGFFSENCSLVPDPGQLDFDLYWHWQLHYLTTDAMWTSYVKKVKRRNGMAMFVLYVDCSEIRHFESLSKVGHVTQCQVPMGANVQCNLTQVLPEQSSLSCDEWHAIRIISDHLKKNPAMTTTEIAAYLAETCGEQISHAIAWRLKQKALEWEFGTFYELYNYAPRLLKDIRYGCKSHLHFVDTEDTEVAGCKDFRVLHSIFWAFAQCIRAFASCRPVLCIKSMPLCGKYQGVLLTAIALDANDNYIPVAFAVVESESTKSWLWFLMNLKRGIVKERRHVCIIHEYKREVSDAIDVLQNNQKEEHAWRDVKSRWCMQHLAENFLAHFGDEKLMTLFNKLCQQNKQSKFVKIWKELDKLTLKHSSEKHSSASAEVQQESIECDGAELEAQGPCNQDDSVQDVEEGNNASDSNGNRTVLSFSEWIRPKPMEKWSLLHDTFRARYGLMGINIEDLNNNHVLKGINCLPLAGMVEMTFQRLVEYFNNNSAAAKKAMGNPSMNFPECIQSDMNSKMQKSQMHQVIHMNAEDKNSFPVKVDKMFKVQLKQKRVIVHLKSVYKRSMNKDKKCVPSAERSNTLWSLGKGIFRQPFPYSFCKEANLGPPGYKWRDSTTELDPSFNKDHKYTIQEIATCSCNKPQRHHKPCSHVIAVCCQIGASIATYLSPYYSLTNLVETWNGAFDQSNTFDFKYNYRTYKSLVPWEIAPWVTDKKTTWIPNKKLECGRPAFQTSDCRHTGMDKEHQQCITEGTAVTHSQGTVLPGCT